MKIISINAKHTDDNRHVAFNVNTVPTEIDEIIKKIDCGKLHIGFKNNLLYANAQNSKEPINAETVKIIDEAIAKAEDLVKRELDDAKRERENMLNSLSKSTGLEVVSDDD